MGVLISDVVMALSGCDAFPWSAKRIGTRASVPLGHPKDRARLLPPMGEADAHRRHDERNERCKRLLPDTKKHAAFRFSTGLDRVNRIVCTICTSTVGRQ